MERWKVEDLSLLEGSVAWRTKGSPRRGTKRTCVADDTVKITRVTTLSALDNCFSSSSLAGLKPWQITRSPPIFFVLDYTVCLFDNNLVRDHVSRRRGGLFVFNACYATVACRSVLVINLHLMRYKWTSGIISVVNSSCYKLLVFPIFPFFFFLSQENVQLCATLYKNWPRLICILLVFNSIFSLFWNLSSNYT